MLRNFATFLYSRDEATVDVHWVCQLLYHILRTVEYVVLFISAWASALLVSLYRAMRRPLSVGRATGTDSRAFSFITLFVLGESGQLKPDMPFSKQNSKETNDNKQQLFVVSMYFFIPIEKLNAYFEEEIQKSQTRITAPDYIQNAGFICKYLDLSNSGSISNQDFLYKYHEPQNGKLILRKINLRPYIFQFYPDKTQKNGIPFLVIGTSINKKFANSSASDFCTEQDVIMLRQSLLESNGYGAYFQKNNEIIHHRDWLESIVQEVEGIKELNENRKKHISFFNSITEISTSTIEVKDIKNYEKAFSDEYFRTDISNITISKDEKRFCYGILTGNDNYTRVPDYELDTILKKGYSNNHTEHTYAMPKSIVLYKKHHPFPYATKIPVNPESLSLIQYIHEMCGCLYIDRKLKIARQQLSLSGEPENIKNVLSDLAETLGTKLFRITEAEHRAEYIYNSFGLREEYDRLKERGNLLADALNIKYSKLNNTILLILAILTLIIGITQVLVQIMDKCIK